VKLGAPQNRSKDRRKCLKNLTLLTGISLLLVVVLVLVLVNFKAFRGRGGGRGRPGAPL